MNVSQERVIAIEVRADADDRQNVILAPNRWGIPDMAVQRLKVQVVTGRIGHHLAVKHRDGAWRHPHLRH
jgi:hypothetical protein